MSEEAESREAMMASIAGRIGPRDGACAGRHATGIWDRTRATSARRGAGGICPRCRDTRKSQHDPGAAMVGVALDARLELCRHGADDALAHPGRARVGF